MGGSGIAECERGELLMAISDLTGTSWQFPATGVGLSGGDILASISFESNGNEFIRLDCSEGLSGPVLVYRLSASVTVYDAATGWADEAYRIIDITGGSGATSAAVIAWLEAEAEQIPGPELRKTYTTTGAELASVADAIRARGGYPASNLLEYPAGFVTGIENIPDTQPETLACVVCSGSGTTFVTIGSDQNKPFIYSYVPDFFSYNAGVFTCKKAGTYSVRVYARGAYNSSGTAINCYWRFYKNSEIVESYTSGTVYRNPGAITAFGVTLAENDTFYGQVRNSSGTTTVTLAYIIY